MNYKDREELYAGEILHHVDYPKTDHWLPGDNKELYDKHCKDDSLRHILELNGFYPYTPITYNINRQGFRDNRDLSLEKPGNFIAIGCSITAGDGLFQEQTYAYKLEQQLEQPVYNLGLPGRGHEAMFRVLSYYVPKLRPKAVFLQTTSTTRRELFSSDNGKIVVYEPVGHWSVDDNPDNDKQAIDTKLRMLADQDVYFASKRTFYAIDALCKHNNVELYVLDGWNLILQKRLNTEGMATDLARDLRHAGPLYHTRLAEQFLKAYNTKTPINDIYDESLYIQDILPTGHIRKSIRKTPN